MPWISGANTSKAKEATVCIPHTTSNQNKEGIIYNTWQYIYLVMEKKSHITHHTASLTSLGSRIDLSAVPDFMLLQELHTK